MIFRVHFPPQEKFPSLSQKLKVKLWRTGVSVFCLKHSDCCDRRSWKTGSHRCRAELFWAIFLFCLGPCAHVCSPHPDSLPERLKRAGCACMNEMSWKLYIRGMYQGSFLSFPSFLVLLPLLQTIHGVELSWDLEDWWSSFSSYFPPLFLFSLPLCEVWVQYSHIWYWSFLWELGTFGSVLWIISQHLWEIVCCGLWASTFEKFTVGTKSLLNLSVIIQGLLATTFENCVVKIMSWLASTFESKTVGWLLEIRWPYNKSIRVPWHMD